MSSAVAAVAPVKAGFMASTSRPAKPAITIPTTLPPSKPVIPTIIITPPDAPHQYSSPIPEQVYEKKVLFVPVKTEELGWDEHGLYWNGTYAYPVHQIYNKEGNSIGRRRRGPVGYRFEEYYEGNKQRDADAQDEARVRLDEPAPARIESTAHQVARSMDEDQTQAEQTVEEQSPISPTLSEASETEDGSSFCSDDASSFWSSNDDVESQCTSPGTSSPSEEAENTSLPADKLCDKLSALSSPTSPTKTTWLSLGTLAPSTATASSSRSQSLPAAFETPSSTRSKSTLITEPQSRQHKRRNRTHNASAYSRIIDDLVTSPFASSKSPLRSATLPRSTRRSTSKLGSGTSSLLRSPSLTAARSHSPSTTPLKTRRWGGEEFAAGWTFENQTAAMSTRWDESFASHY